MVIRKSTEETLVVDGTPEEWLKKCRAALERQNFTKIAASDSLRQLHANYKKVTIWGTLDITLVPHDGSSTQMHLVATSNVDNVFALFRSPGRKILDTFKSGLPQL